MEDKIIDILKRVLELNIIEKSISQKNCEKWDSMAQLNLVVELEGEFGIVIEPEEIGEMKCFTDIVRIVGTKLL